MAVSKVKKEFTKVENTSKRKFSNDILNHLKAKSVKKNKNDFKKYHSITLKSPSEIKQIKGSSKKIPVIVGENNINDMNQDFYRAWKTYLTIMMKH